jgi:hypothetical protein
MPLPPDEPMPPLLESRFSPPLDAQEASYFAASERIASRSFKDLFIVCSLYVLLDFFKPA